MRRVAHLLAFTVLLFLAVPTLRAQEKKAPQFDRTEAMVPMRDGAKLFTTLHVPKDAKEPLPIIFLRTPSGIDGRTENLLKSYFKDLAEDGYAFALQDIRGRFKSEGT